MDDGVITDEKRQLLVLLAESYNIDQDRLDYIESSLDATSAEEE